MQETQRPLNECAACGNTWYPRGKDLSDRCPQCHGGDVRLWLPPPPSAEDLAQIAETERFIAAQRAEHEQFLARLNRETEAHAKGQIWRSVGGAAALVVAVVLVVAFWDYIVGALALLALALVLGLFGCRRRRRRWR